MQDFNKNTSPGVGTHANPYKLQATRHFDLNHISEHAFPVACNLPGVLSPAKNIREHLTCIFGGFTSMLSTSQILQASLHMFLGYVKGACTAAVTYAAIALIGSTFHLSQSKLLVSPLDAPIVVRLNPKV